MNLNINFKYIYLFVEIIISISFVFILAFYMWLALQEILVSIRNYNFTKAKNCNPDECGLFHLLDNEAETKDCLSPFVRRKFFLRLSEGGKQRGCRHSIQVREVKSRKSAIEYKNEFLDTYNAFHISQIWWRVIIILAGAIMLIVGTVSAETVSDFLFR